MRPEYVVMLINAGIVLVAYLGVYPRIRDMTLKKLSWISAGFTALALGVAYVLYGGGTEFNLVLFNTNWFFFSFITLTVMEWPFARDFMRDNDLM